MARRAVATVHCLGSSGRTGARAQPGRWASFTREGRAPGRRHPRPAPCPSKERHRLVTRCTGICEAGSPCCRWAIRGKDPPAAASTNPRQRGPQGRHRAYRRGLPGGPLGPPPADRPGRPVRSGSPAPRPHHRTSAGRAERGIGGGLVGRTTTLRRGGEGGVADGGVWIGGDEGWN